MRVRHVRWWIPAFFAAEFLFSLGLLIHVCVVDAEDVSPGALAGFIALCVAGMIAFGRRLWQCWRVIREAHRASDR